MNTRVGQGPSVQLLIPLLALAGFFLILQHQRHFDVRDISAFEAKELIALGSVVIDVRGEQQYGGRHIPGAISVPLSSLKNAIPASVPRDTTKPIVVYCGDGVAIGPEGTSILNKAGYSKAVNLQGGIQGWVDAGFPVEKLVAPKA